MAKMSSAGFLANNDYGADSDSVQTGRVVENRSGSIDNFLDVRWASELKLFCQSPQKCLN